MLGFPPHVFDRNSDTSPLICLFAIATYTGGNKRGDNFGSRRQRPVATSPTASRKTGPARNAPRCNPTRWATSGETRCTAAPASRMWRNTRTANRSGERGATAPESGAVTIGAICRFRSSWYGCVPKNRGDSPTNAAYLGRQIDKPSPAGIHKPRSNIKFHTLPTSNTHHEDPPTN